MREVEPKDQQLMVALRIRPLNDSELEEGATVIAHKVGDQVAVLMDPGEDAEDTLRSHRARDKTFTFDVVFDQHASQEDVYCATTQHLVEGVISGYNATVFAYGPSGAGKTHTMLGMDAEPGIYLRTLTDLFRAIEEASDRTDYSVSMSYLEIYNEVIRDLLNPSSGFLELREDSRGSIQIAGITEVSTSNAQEIMQLLTRGNRQRTQEPTAANQTSSRSHAVLQVAVRQQRRGSAAAEEVRVGRLFMVDLAGSERASQAQNRGKRMQEGAHINRSLLALGTCINALSEKGGGRAQYVNFRDSKLTRLLKDALGGNSRTVMIAHISPASTHFEESRTTLLYAYRAKNIKTRVKRNLLSVSYHLAQYTDVISDLHGKIERLKSKIERQEQEKKREPGVRDARGTMPTQDTEEDSHLQMDRIRAQLVGAFREQLEMRRSLAELENANVELHVDASRHLLAIADWEREKTQHHAQDRTPEGDEEQMVADTDMDAGKSAEPHEVALAREEVNMLLAEQRKTAALKAELEQRLACAQEKASQLQQLLPAQAISADQKEVLRLLCRAHELEVENTELQASSLRRANLLCQKDVVIQRLQQHRLLSERVIRGQQRLLQDSGIRVPAPLDRCSRELGGGALDRLLLLHSVLASSLQDGSCPPPEEPSRDQPDDKKDTPWGAHFQLPPMLLETDSEGRKSSKATPSKDPGTQALLLPPTPLCVLLTPPAPEEPSSRSLKGLVSKLGSPAGLRMGSPRRAAEALKEMALSTKSIALVAAARRSKAQDRGASSRRSSLHPPEGSRDPSPADGRWPCSSRARGHSVERKASTGPSPCLTHGLQQATEKLQPPSLGHLDESQTPHAPRQLSKSSARRRSPAVPGTSKIQPSLVVHAGSADSRGRRHSPLPPGNPRKHQPGSAKKPRTPK
uniref:Kinesin-like protein n=3 Tax=Rousettus aegyptiacus TaxID=9407 RepID=A0A7J8FIM7_ROUAE|nr:hypothetical protein HJG63_012019 [Rousettus aegyptiacus]